MLKVEQLHALARAVYYGQRWRISAREVYDQMNACSCLTLILACIIYWMAYYGPCEALDIHCDRIVGFLESADPH